MGGERLQYKHKSSNYPKTSPCPDGRPSPYQGEGQVLLGKTRVRFLWAIQETLCIPETGVALTEETEVSLGYSRNSVYTVGREREEHLI